MSGVKKVITNNQKVVEMSKQLEQATTDEERHRIANSDLFMVGTFEDREVFLHEAIWVKANKKLIPLGKLVNHKDGNPMNNDPDNLELVDENKEYGDLHETRNKVFHETLEDKEFIRRNFDDIYEVLYN